MEIVGFLDRLERNKPANNCASFIMGKINHCAVDDGDVEVRPSDLPVEFNSESIPDQDTTLIKSIEDD